MHENRTLVRGDNLEEMRKFLDLLSAEKKEKRALMPPVEEQTQKSSNWLLRLVGAR